MGISLKNDSHPANVIYDKNHLRYPIEVFPVNPRGGTIQREKVYKDITEIPKKIDLAVIAARADFVPEIMKKCIANDVGGAVVISGGFAETGKTDIQDQLVEMASAAGFPFIGPNCLGIYAPSQIDTFFLPGERLIRPGTGSVAFISQSGGVLVDQMVKFASQGLGISLAVSIGNKALVKEIDLLRYLAEDPKTRVISFYIEGFDMDEGKQFVFEAGRCSKPVVVLKAGKSEEGKRTAHSHTGSMAGDYRIFSEALRQFGIAEAKNELQLTSFCEALSCYQDSVAGNVGIITVSGGHGVMAVDSCAEHGLLVPKLSAATKKNIKDALSPSINSIASLNNPIDLTGSALDDDFIAAANGLINAAEIDCLLILLLPYSPGITPNLGARLSRICKNQNKTLIAYVPNEGKYRMLIEGFELNQVPVSSSIIGAVLMVKSLQKHK